jgi:hypothetical protein
MEDICLEPCNGPLPVNGNHSVDSRSTIKPNQSSKSKMMNLQNMNSLLLRPLTWTANCVGSEKRVRHFNPARARPGSIGSLPCMSQSVSALQLKPPSPLPQIASDLDATKISGYNFSQDILVRHFKDDAPDQIRLRRDFAPVSLLDIDGECSGSSNMICLDSHTDFEIGVCHGMSSQPSVNEDPCMSSKVLLPESRSKLIFERQDRKGEARASTCLNSLRRADFDYYDDSSLFLPPGPLAITPSWPVTHISSSISFDRNSEILHRCSRDFQLLADDKLERVLRNYQAIQNRCRTRLLARMVIQSWKLSISKKVSVHAKLRLAAYKSRLITLHFSFQRILSYANDRARSSQRRQRLDKGRASRLLRKPFWSWRRVLSEQHYQTKTARSSYLELEAENNEMLSLLDKHKRLSSHQRGLVESLRQKLDSAEHELGNTVLQQRHVIDEMRLRSICDAKVAKSLQRKMLADADEIRRLKRDNAILRAQLQGVNSTLCPHGLGPLNY